MVNFYSYVSLPESISPSEVTNCGQGGFPCLKEVSHAAGEGLCNRYLRTEPLQQIGIEKKSASREWPRFFGSKHWGYPNFGGVYPNGGNSFFFNPLILVLIPTKTFGLPIYVLRFCSRLGGSYISHGGSPALVPWDFYLIAETSLGWQKIWYIINDDYPLANIQKKRWKITVFFIGKSTVFYGPFSIAMLNYLRLPSGKLAVGPWKSAINKVETSLPRQLPGSMLIYRMVASLEPNNYALNLCSQLTIR